MRGSRRRSGPSSRGNAPRSATSGTRSRSTARIGESFPERWNMDNPIRLHWLDPRNPRQPFPPAQMAMRDPNGLLAIGGDLSATRLLQAYAQGIFPWYNTDEPI